MPVPPQNSQSESDYHKLGLKEFFQIFKWSIKLVFSMQPIYASIYLTTRTIREFTGIINSFILAKIIDTLVRVVNTPQADLSVLYPYLAAILVFNTLNTLVGFFNNFSMNNLRTRTRPQIVSALYTKLSDLGVQTLEQPDINNKIYRANMYIHNLLGYFQSSISLIAEMVKLSSSFIIVATVLPFLLPVIVLSLIPYFINDKKYRAIIYKYGFDNTEGNRRAGDTSHDLSSPPDLQEINITRSFNYLHKKFWDFQNIYIKGWVNILKKWFIGSRIYMYFSDLTILGGQVYILRNAILGIVTIGDVTFYSRILSTLQDSLMNTSNLINDLFESSLQIKDVYSLFITEPAFPDGTKTLPKLEKGPEILFRNVFFTYPNSERIVIDNLNLKVKSGEKIAIVGPNGAGKTTLVKLLTRIYQTTGGEILINGNNINELKAQSIYQNTGILFQDYNTYPQLTVKENIYIGNTETPPDETAIRLAAQQADALSFIEEYPKKFDQVLSEKYKGGIRPSTGQWQKIAIARFFYRNAPLVIFDEPTAAIDPVSEFHIFNKIYEFFKDKTVIIISHKFSTVRNADRILVMDKGKIIEEGSHAQLMNLNGRYAEAFLLQAQGYSQNN